MFKNKTTSAFRLELISLFIITILISSAWVALQLTSDSSPNVQRGQLNTAVLAQAEPVPYTPPTLEAELGELLQDIDANFQQHYAIHVIDLDTDQSVHINADRQMKAASLYKLFVANEAFKKVDQGTLAASQTLDSSRGLDTIGCIEIMIQVSDNGCGVILQRVVGASYKNPEEIAAAGYSDTDISGVYPTTTASDVAALLQSLDKQSYLSQPANEMFKLFLASQQLRTRIPSELPDSVSIMNKTADLEGYAHDAAIIASDKRRYVLVVMSEPYSASYAQRHADIAEISRAIYDQLH